MSWTCQYKPFHTVCIYICQCFLSYEFLLLVYTFFVYNSASSFEFLFLSTLTAYTFFMFLICNIISILFAIHILVSYIKIYKYVLLYISFSALLHFIYIMTGFLIRVQLVGEHSEQNGHFGQNGQKLHENYKIHIF